MDILKRNLAEFLRKGQLDLTVTGFDMDAFERAMHRDLSRRLLEIRAIVYEDGDLLSDAEKVEAVRRCFEEN